MGQLIYRISTEENPKLSEVGGKAKALIETSKAGFPVPKGLVLSVEFFKPWLSSIKESTLWSELLQDVTKEKCEEIKQKAVQLTFNEDQRTELESAMDYLSSEAILVVRSSSPDEDLESASFAGVYETYLGVIEAELESVISKVFASMFDFRVLEYKEQHDVNLENTSLSVIIQKQIHSDVSGVCFSQNPQNGQNNEVMINANFGLGETVVSGQVTPDIYVVKDKQIIQKKIAHKHISVVLSRGGGTKEVENEEPLAETLTEGQVLQLSELTQKIALHYHKPVDIEWAFEHDVLHLLQVRPITTAPLFFNWDVEDLGRGTMYAHAGIAESMPTPLCPLYADFVAIHVPETIGMLMDRLLGEGNAGVMHDTRFITVNGYGYYGMRATLRMMWPFVRRLRLTIRLFDEHPEWVENEELPLIIARLEELKTTKIQYTDSKLLLEMAHTLTKMICKYYTFCQIYLAQAYKSEGLFNQFYDKKIRPETQILSHVFMLGEDSLPILADQALYRLAEWVKEDQSLSQIIINTKAIESILDDDRLELESFKQRFREHIDQYGHMIYDLDFSIPTPVEQPQPIFEALKIYMSGEAVSPIIRQKEALRNREAAEEKVKTTVSPSLYKKFKRKLENARKFAPYREDGLANLGLCQPYLRAVLIELGKRLQSSKVIKEPEDVFWLELEELNGFIGHEITGSKYAEVENRKALNKVQSKVNAPFILPKNAKMFGFKVDAWLPKEMDEDPNAIRFEGLGVSGGTITGKARVIHSVDEFDLMEQGEILVTSMTTPAWTPLFALAKGIVTDFGGPLSHSSIVAREYGIPAVLGTGGSSKVIQSGQTIMVDGDNGIVKIVET